MIFICLVEVIERMVGLYVERENLREYRRKYVVFYFRYIEFDVLFGGENF